MKTLRCKKGDRVLVVRAPDTPAIIGLVTVIVYDARDVDAHPNDDWVIDTSHTDVTPVDMGSIQDECLVPLRGDPDAVETLRTIEAPA